MNLVPANYTAAATTPTEPALSTSTSVASTTTAAASYLASSSNARQTIGTRSSWSVNSSSSSGSGRVSSNQNNNSYLQQFTVGGNGSSRDTGEQSKSSLEKTFHRADPIQGAGARTPFKKLPVYLNNSSNSLYTTASNWDYSSALAGDGATTQIRAKNQHMNFIKHDANRIDDKRKVLELSIIHLVEHSLLAHGNGEPELALARAKEAIERFNSLKIAIMQDKSSSSVSNQAKNQGEPLASVANQSMMTRGVSLFELSIMVESNLAAQMRNNGQLEEAIELYSQLCRLATSSGADSSQVAASLVSRSHNPQSSDAKYLLCRFGMNIGNLYYEKGEYQRALKYYRLTLDRLASTGSHYENLKIKLMNNVSVTLFASEQCGEATVNSLNLLLADNLSRYHQGTGNSSIVDARNSHHHRFGLNLMLCHYQRSDLKSMMITLDNLVKVNICHQYQQVPLDTSAFAGCNRHQHARSERLMIRDDSIAMGATQQTYQIMDRQLNESVTNSNRNDASSAGNASQSTSVMSDAPTMLGNSASSMNPELESRSINRLESLIGEKSMQILRCFTISCYLMLDLEARTRQFAHISIKRDTDQNSSLFDYCIEIFKNSQFYKSIVFDLKANSVANLVAKRHGLDEAISILSNIATNDSDNKPGPKESDGPGFEASSIKSPAVAAYSSLYNLITGNLEMAKKDGYSALKLDNTNVQSIINLGNCYTMLNDYVTAESFYRRSLMLDPQSWIANYNLSLIYRLRGRNYDELAPDTKSFLENNLINLTALIDDKMLLPVMQSSIISHRSKHSRRWDIIMEGIVSNAEMSPDVRFLASKLLETDTGSESSKVSSARYRQTHEEHPYYIPLAERLIALSIQEFKYHAAMKLLITCISNRPDQIRWYQMLAECHRRAADYNSAISTYKATIDLFPQDSTCLRALIKLFDELGLSNEKQIYETKLDKLLSAQARVS